jgi:glycosyltransferase involved in cell wall biosynthesis
VRRGVRRAIHSALLRRANRVVAVADAVRRETVDVFRVAPERVVTIPRGIDPRRISARRSRAEVRRELEIPAVAPVLIAVIALSWEKDPLAHLDLCERLVRSMPDVTYLFAGDGPLREELATAVDSRGLKEHVRILGMRTDIGDLLQASDVLVLASRPDGMEGMPGCLIEAGMAGVPAVAFDVAGVSEVIEDGVTGFVVEHGDRDRLFQRACELLSDDGLRHTMGREAMERCRTTFDIGSVASRYIGTYADVVRS